MRIMCIWTRQQEENYMKIASSKSELKNARVAGRKPDKIITKDGDISPIKKKDLRKYIANTGQIIVGKEVIYDGKHGKR